MSHVKTAVSIPRALFKKAEALARKLRLSRSGLFALALEEFQQRQENLELLERINKAQDDGPTPSERALRRRMLASHRRLVRGEW
mgnify:CR=1 FL=1